MEAKNSRARNYFLMPLSWENKIINPSFTRKQEVVSSYYLECLQSQQDQWSALARKAAAEPKFKVKG